MAEYLIRGSAAILRVDNPPVNALSHHVRKALRDGIARAQNDVNVSSVVIYGAGNKFLAGADIKEFGSNFGNAPILGDLCNIIEASNKPVISAIERFALGGGMEVAISSHYRIAHVDSMFGFPEVDLGILPAATGTQRFPRLVGLKAALEYISTGQRFTAAKAKEIGAVDKVVEKDLLEEAIKFANEVGRKPVDGRRTSKMQVKDAANAKHLYAAAIENANKRNPGAMAPAFAIKSVMASLMDSFEDGLKVELDNMIILSTSSHARALQYAFFAQRAASQWSLKDGSNHKNTKPNPIRSIGVIGAGTMGTGIAMSALNAGLKVYLLEQNQEFLDKGMKLLKSLYKGSVALGKLKSEVAEKRLSNIHATISYESLRDVDLVVEAVYENLKLKQKVFTKLDQICRKDAILCSNTSGISIDEIASATERPDRVVGTHFFVPAYYMRLLENVRGQKTSPVAIATATAFGQTLGKVPVLVGNCTGFVGNRIMRPFNVEAAFLVEEGCWPEEVDQVARDFGFPLGPFEVSDLSGLDVGASILMESANSSNVKLDENTRFLNGRRLSTLSLMLYQRKRYGRKTGAGWYNYEHPGAKVSYKSDLVRDLITSYRERHGIKVRKISHQEIMERLLFGLINEGFKILEEQIASKPEEIDTICLLGFGWPKHNGGPMFHAHTTGLDYVYKKVQDYYKQHATSPHWKPSALLQKLAGESIPITQWHSRL